MGIDGCGRGIPRPSRCSTRRSCSRLQHSSAECPGGRPAGETSTYLSELERLNAGVRFPDTPLGSPGPQPGRARRLHQRVPPRRADQRRPAFGVTLAHPPRHPQHSAGGLDLHAESRGPGVPGRVGQGLGDHVVRAGLDLFRQSSSHADLEVDGGPASGWRASRRRNPRPLSLRIAGCGPWARWLLPQSRR
jgi:hypothetical protein